MNEPWDEIIRDTAGNAIAWITSDASCQNESCRRAIKQGRPIHIIPAHTDPRRTQEDAITIAMPEYHFSTVAEAVEALENAWATAETVYTIPDREAAYARKVPVKIAHS